LSWPGAFEEQNLRSTIEQAAKRLAQLQESGVEVSPARSDALPERIEPKLESVPMRVAKELESRESGSSGSADRVPESYSPVAEQAPGAVSTAPSRVDIDLARLSASGYISPHAPRSRLAEEFRVVKRPLLNNASGKSTSPVRNANRLMVTSSLPGEGKTFVSVNLAMSLAMELDTHVLLVDADASRPAVLERLGLPPSKGLLDLLVDPTLSVDDVVLPTNVERLSILPAGTPQAHATELLASDGMSRLVERLASQDARRILVFDTPPLLAASESRVLAAHMGQVVMVIGADDTPQGTVAEALATIENCPVVFTLLNRVAASERGHYYGSYGAYSH
jgi:receptor protein-tyrosine kinase